MTLEELKALYKEKGATTPREEETEQGTKYYNDAVQLGDGWTAFENQPEIIGYEGQGMDAQPIYGTVDPDKKLGGFQRSEGNKNYYYDTDGKLFHVEKQATDWDYLGPIIMGAATMGGGAGALGSYLFPSLGATAAAGAGGALLGGANAAFTDQNILKGALLGGVSGAGAQEIGKIGDTSVKLGDVKKAYDFIQNPSLAGVVNAASPYVGSTQLGDTGMSIGDIFKGVGTAKALSSGDDRQIFNALTGMAKDQGKSIKLGFGPGDMDQFSEDLIPGYFQPGGEGYIDPTRQDITVSEQPENIDSLLRALSPYATDEGKSIFTQTEDVPEFETVDKRPIASLDSIFGTPDILQPVEADVPELTITDDREKEYVPGIRTKEIKSDIPDELTEDDIDKLFPDLDITKILETITPTKTVTPAKTVVPTTTTPGTQSVQKSLANLGLGEMQQAASQDPYADIKLMEEMFGPDIAYKLLSLGGNKRK
jgi:hypothetical protein